MSDQMTPEQIVTKFIDCINEMDLEAAASFLSEDCEYDNVPMGKVFGRDTIFQQLQPMMGRCEQIDWITLRQTSTGSTVMNERLDYFDPPKGNSFGLPVAGAFKLEGPLIVEWRDYFCMRQFAEGTGLEF